MPTSREVIEKELKLRRTMLEHVSPQAAGLVGKQIDGLEELLGTDAGYAQETQLNENPGCFGALLKFLSG